VIDIQSVKNNLNTFQTQWRQCQLGHLRDSCKSPPGATWRPLDTDWDDGGRGPWRSVDTKRRRTVDHCNANQRLTEHRPNSPGNPDYGEHTGPVEDDRSVPTTPGRRHQDGDIELWTSRLDNILLSLELGELISIKLSVNGFTVRHRLSIDLLI